MSELRSCIDTTGMSIVDSLHAMLILCTLPSNYEIVQQTILANVSDYKTLTSIGMRSRILSEELRQGTNGNINAIKAAGKYGNKNTCNFCGGPGHWENDCHRKLQGLSKQEAQSERKNGKAKGKDKENEVKGETPSVSATIQELSDDLPCVNSAVTVQPTYNDAIIFYFARETRWMLDSGCSDHITSDISDFSEYRSLPTPQHIHLADGNTQVSYISVGTVSATTMIKGTKKRILLKDVIHSPDLGGRFISIRKIGERGISTAFIGNTATLSKNGTDYAEGHLLGQQYWLMLRISAPSIHLTQRKIPIDVLHDVLDTCLGHCSKSSMIR